MSDGPRVATAATARMAAKPAAAVGPSLYAQRKWLSDVPDGWIKEGFGFHRFSLRGLEKLRAAWNLGCLALNIERMQGLQTA